MWQGERRWTAILPAIHAARRRAHDLPPSTRTQQRIHQLYFDIRYMAASMATPRRGELELRILPWHRRRSRIVRSRLPEAIEGNGY